MTDEDEEIREGMIVPVEAIDSDLVNIHEQGDDEGSTFTLAQLNELGISAPLATPDIMRAAYAFRRRTAAAMLDREHDFLYTIQYQEQGGKTKEKMTTSYKEALKFRDTYQVPYKATPRKSGIAKLATAFCVEGTIVEMKGLPVEHNADYCYIKYEVIAKKSGAKAIGVGFARRNERGYPMPEHHMIGLADTRAYGRAVLRLAGFGEAGAEEIDGDIQMATVRLEMGPQSAPQRLAPSTGAQVIDVQSQETKAPVSTPVQAAPAATKVAAPAPTPAPAAAPATATQPARQVPNEVPMPASGPSTITEAQVGKLSALLKAKLGSRERAQQWLLDHAKVNTSRAVPESAYADLVKKLEALETP